MMLFISRLFSVGYFVMFVNERSYQPCQRPECFNNLLIIHDTIESGCRAFFFVGYLLYLINDRSVLYLNKWFICEENTL